MLIVLTSERLPDNEAGTINLLFDHGLAHLHLRKPTSNIDQYRGLLKRIEKAHHRKIVVHQHHGLCDEFGLKGIHFQEHHRIALGHHLQHTIDRYRGNGYSVSSSFHSTDDILNCQATFDYVLLSPVFDSISKAGHAGERFNVSALGTQVVGLGGINEYSIKEAFDLGYYGVGALGGIWDTEDSLTGFLKLKHSYMQFNV